MAVILLDEPLHLFFMIVDTIGWKRKAIGVKPMVIPAKHFCFQVITYFVYQIYLQKRFPTNEIPNDRLFPELVLMVENVINSLFCYLPGHLLFCILSYEVAVFTSKLAVFRDYEGDVLCHPRLPNIFIFLYLLHVILSRTAWTRILTTTTTRVFATSLTSCVTITNAITFTITLTSISAPTNAGVQATIFTGIYACTLACFSASMLAYLITIPNTFSRTVTLATHYRIFFCI